MAGNPITPTVVETLLLTDTSANALVVGGAIGATAGTGGIKAGPIVSSSTMTATGAIASSGSNVSDSVGSMATIRAGGIGMTSQAANDLIYATSASQLARIANAAKGVLVTSASNVPSLLTGALAFQVLRMNAGATAFEFAGVVAPPAAVMSTAFETAGRFGLGTGVAGGGSNTFGIHGVVLDTSATGTSGCLVQMEVQRDATTFNGSPFFSCRLDVETVGTDFDIFVGLSEYAAATGSAISDTTRHIGFKITRAASGTVNIFATQADGTTENKTQVTTSAGVYDFAFKVNGTSSVDYWWTKNVGAWSSATNLTSNLPSGSAAGGPTLMLSNRATATQTAVRVYFMSEIQ